MIAKLLPLSLLLLSGCQNLVSAPPSPFSELDRLPPIRTTLACLPKPAALVAAHRGTSAAFREPENSVSALERLIDQGTIMAEIDIAALRDGTPVIFHDGVWDYHTDQTGPVASTSAEKFSRLRLKDRRGSVTSETVPTLAAMLDAAKGRIYLEIDFKTSSDIKRSIQMIRERDMTDQVVLIATDQAEATKLRPYAPEFLLSLPRARKRIVANAKQGVWIGGRWRDGAERRIEDRHYVFGAQWKKNPGELGKAARALDVLVTDQAQRYAPVAGLKKAAAFKACLSADEDG